MTNHETALEAAAAVISTETSIWGDSSMELTKSVVSAYLSTLSPDVSGPVEATTEGDLEIRAAQITMGRGLVDVSRIEHEGRAGILFRPRKIHIPVGEPGELPAGEYWPVEGDVVIWIESTGGAQVIHDYLVPFLPPQSDALASLSLQLAAVEEERDQLRTGIKRLSDEEELCAETTGDDPFSLVYLAAKLADAEKRYYEADKSDMSARDLLNDLEASLSAVQEENERLRRNLERRDAYIVDQGLWMEFVSTLSTPSEEDKT